MKTGSLAFLLAVGLPGALAAQTASPAPNAAVGTMRELWKSVTDYITTAAAEAPEAQYGYRPVATVRSFGQLIAHIAGAQYLMCAAALGDPAREEDEIERTKTSKAELVAALRASTEYCGKAYAQSDADAARPAQLFGQERTRLYALGLNATHNGEHYGNIVTYLRMQGSIPPSSRRP
ncbi:MAG TPA: DinB family protein [Gemmatimonadales bacterium]|jgi:uncharacterized damage-inducible protein DinB|nr:DinB family protein [Gemmatimonadales bacterium]